MMIDDAVAEVADVVEECDCDCANHDRHDDATMYCASIARQTSDVDDVVRRATSASSTSTKTTSDELDRHSNDAAAEDDSRDDSDAADAKIHSNDVVAVVVIGVRSR